MEASFVRIAHRRKPLTESLKGPPRSTGQAHGIVGIRAQARPEMRAGYVPDAGSRPSRQFHPVEERLAAGQPEGQPRAEDPADGPAESRRGRLTGSLTGDVNSRRLL